MRPFITWANSFRSTTKRRIEGGWLVTWPFDDRNGFASILCFAQDQIGNCIAMTGCLTVLLRKLASAIEDYASIILRRLDCEMEQVGRGFGAYNLDSALMRRDTVIAKFFHPAVPRFANDFSEGVTDETPSRVPAASAGYQRRRAV